MEDTDHINTDEPEILDEDLEIVSMAGRILGALQGRLDAATEAFNTSYRNGLHDEHELAGYFGHDPKPDRPPVVVLCGSTRFRDEFQEENRRLTLAGCIVLAPGVFGHAGDPAPSEAEKESLDELHFRKIDLADRVVVINPGGYVGDSTRREIDYAISCGKVISWLEGGPDTMADIAERLAREDTLEALAARLAEEVKAKKVEPCRCADAEDDPHAQGEHTSCDSQTEPCGTCNTCMSARRIVGQMPEAKPEHGWDADDEGEADCATGCTRHETCRTANSAAEPDVVKFHASDYADKLTFDAVPSWLTAALDTGVVRGVFKGEDYWYLEVKTTDGIVMAEPGDTVHRHHDGGLLVRSPDGLCKKVSGKPTAEKPTTWCGNPDHPNPCGDCDTVLIEASEGLRQRMPGRHNAAA